MEIPIVDHLYLERLELGQGWHALNLRWCESHNSHPGLTREAPAKTLGPSVPHLRAEKEELDNTARRFDASLPGSRVILGPDMHILIQVVGARMEESHVRYSKLSIMTTTKRFSIWGPRGPIGVERRQ